MTPATRFRPRTLRRLPALWLLTLLLAGCVSAQSWEATRLLQDIDAMGGPSELKQRTPAPQRTTESFSVAERSQVADFYHPQQPLGGAIVLLPGFTPSGKNDSRVVELARSLARARFLVMVPDLRGSRELRVRPEDSRTIGDALRHLQRTRPEAAAHGVGVVAISYAVGLAIRAGLDVAADAPADFIVGLGGYHDSRAVITFATTGRFRLPDSRDWRKGDPLVWAKWVFLAGNAAVLDDASDRRRLRAVGEACFDDCDPDVAALERDLGPEGQSLLTLIVNNDPARVPALIEDLPEAVRQRIETLSPSRYDLAPLAGKLILVHGRLDPLVPYSESLALARAVPGSEVFLIDDFSHITPRGVSWTGKLQLIDAIQAVLARRAPAKMTP